MYRQLLITLISLLGIVSGLNAQLPSQYYELEYEARQTQYHALVIIDSQARGVVRTRFYDRILHKYQLIEQKIHVTGTRGPESIFRLSSASAKDVATGSVSIYPTDHFYVSVDPKQQVFFDRINEQGGKSAVTVRVLEKPALVSLLPTFGWDAPQMDSPIPGIRNHAGRAVKLAVNKGNSDWNTLYLHNNYQKSVEQQYGSTYKVRIYTPGKGYTAYHANDSMSYFIDWNSHSGMFELYKAEGNGNKRLAQTLAFVK